LDAEEGDLLDWVSGIDPARVVKKLAERAGLESSKYVGVHVATRSPTAGSALLH
jgi:hypothetical protein